MSQHSASTRSNASTSSTNSAARPAGYTGWSLIITLVLAALLALLWALGYGPLQNNCCTKAVVEAAPAISATPVAPAPSNPTLPTAPAPSLAKVDDGCTSALKLQVGFETGVATLKPQGKAALDGMVKCFNAPTLVVGHTDNVGGDQANLKLSLARAHSVVSYLVSKGVTPALLTAKGAGETKPIADNTSAEGRAQNRRMEFVVQ